MFHKINAVTPAEDYTLLAQFACGAQKRYDVKPLFNQIPAFKMLKDVEHLFSQVRVDAGGYGISWNDELDLSCNELWDYGHLIS